MNGDRQDERRVVPHCIAMIAGIGAIGTLAHVFANGSASNIGPGSNLDLTLTPAANHSMSPVSMTAAADGQKPPSAKLVQILAARYRLAAERDGMESLKLPVAFDRLSRNAPAIAANERRLFESRRLAFESRQRDMRHRVKAIHDEIEGFERQRNAKEEEIGLIREELRAVEKMRQREFASLPRVLNLKRDLTRARWDLGSIDAAVARSRLLIKEVEQSMHEIKHAVIVDAEREIRDIDVEIGAFSGTDEALSGSFTALVLELQSTRQRDRMLRGANYSKQ